MSTVTGTMVRTEMIESPAAASTTSEVIESRVTTAAAAATSTTGTTSASVSALSSGTMVSTNSGNQTSSSSSSQSIGQQSSSTAQSSSAGSKGRSNIDGIDEEWFEIQGYQFQYKNLVLVRKWLDEGNSIKLIHESLQKREAQRQLKIRQDEGASNYYVSQQYSAQGSPYRSSSSTSATSSSSSFLSPGGILNQGLSTPVRFSVQQLEAQQQAKQASLKTSNMWETMYYENQRQKAQQVVNKYQTPPTKQGTSNEIRTSTPQVNILAPKPQSSSSSLPIISEEAMEAKHDHDRNQVKVKVETGGYLTPELGTFFDELANYQGGSQSSSADEMPRLSPVQGDRASSTGGQQQLIINEAVAQQEMRPGFGRQMVNSQGQAVTGDGPNNPYVRAQQRAIENYAHQRQNLLTGRGRYNPPSDPGGGGGDGGGDDDPDDDPNHGGGVYAPFYGRRYSGPQGQGRRQRWPYGPAPQEVEEALTPANVNTPVLGVKMPTAITGVPPKFSASKTKEYVIWEKLFKSFAKGNAQLFLITHPPEEVIQMAIAEDARLLISRHPQAIRALIDAQSGRMRGILEQALGSSAQNFITQITYDRNYADRFDPDLMINRDNDAYALFKAVQTTFVQSNMFEAGRAIERLNSITYNKNDHPSVLNSEIIECTNLLLATDTYANMPPQQLDHQQALAMLRAIRYELPAVYYHLSVLPVVTRVQIYELMLNSWQKNHEGALRGPVKKEKDGKGGDMAHIKGLTPKGDTTHPNKNKDKDCNECGKKGHIAKDCWQKHPELKPTGGKRKRAEDNKNQGEANAIKEKKQSFVCMMKSDGGTNAIETAGRIIPARYTWIADTGTICHATSYYENLDDVELLQEPINLTFPNGGHYKATHQGKVKLNNKLTLNNVVFIKGGDINLVCIAKILDNDKLKIDLTKSLMDIRTKRDKKDPTSRSQSIIEFKRSTASCLWIFKIDHGKRDLIVRQLRGEDRIRPHESQIKKKAVTIADNTVPPDDEVLEDGEVDQHGDQLREKRAQIEKAKKALRDQTAAVTAYANAVLGAPFKSILKNHSKVNMIKFSDVNSLSSSSLFSDSDSEGKDTSDSESSDGEIESIVAPINKGEDKLELYHKRFAHPTLAKLKQFNEIYQLELKPEQLKEDLPFCQPCVEGKQKAKAIHSKWNNEGNFIPAKAAFDRLHADLIGPFSTTSPQGIKVRVRSLAGTLYILTIVDEYTGYRWSIPLKFKDDAEKHIVELFTLIETQYNIKVKGFHSDGGGEFVNTDLKSECRRRGIVFTWTTFDKPQHNGMAERHNDMSLINMRVSMCQAHAPAALYAEALRFGTLVYNLTPRQYESMDGNGVIVKSIASPHYMVNKNNGLFSKIRVWGCDAYVMVPHKIRAKTDKMNSIGVYLGPDEQQNCYRVLIVSKLSIVYSRDVIFREDSFTQIQMVKVNYRQLVAEDKEINADWYLPPGDEFKGLAESVDIRPLTDADDQQEVEDDAEEQQSLLVGVPTAVSFAPAPVVQADPVDDEHDNVVDINDLDELFEEEEPELFDHEAHIQAHDIQLLSEGGNISDEESKYDDDEKSLPLDVPIANERPKRVRMLPQRYTYERRTKAKPHGVPMYAISLLDNKDPSTYKQAVKCKQSLEWLKAIKKEVDQVILKKVFIPVRAPKGRKLLSSRWVFRSKIGADGQIAEHKARVVVRGFEQVPGLDFGDFITAPVVRGSSIRILLILAAKEDLDVDQLDFKSAFLNAEMEEDVYILPPEGFEHLIKEGGHNAFLLNKSLYGLKQAPLRWYTTAVDLFVSLGYSVGIIDKCIFYKHVLITLDGKVERATIILSLYVDDTLVVFNKLARDIWEQDKKKIAATFDIKDLGEAKWILNMLITRDREARTITLSQEVYVNNVVERFGLSAANPMPTPCIIDKLTQQEIDNDVLLDKNDQKYYQSIVGSLMYAAVTTRIDISYAVNMLARHNAAPHNYHVARAKRVVRYLNGTASKVLCFGDKADDSPVISAYCDADWAGDADRKSITGNILMLFGSPVAWQSKKQTTISQSSAEAEYVAIASMCNEVCWLVHWLRDVLDIVIDDIPLYTDSTAAIGIANNEGTHTRVKHIDVKYHLIREHAKNGLIKLVHLPTEDQPADLLTKALSNEQFNKFTNQLLK